MSDVLVPLTIDFLAWLAAEPRDYVDVMDAWRTSCPRLTVWEDAIDAGLISRVHLAGQPTRIVPTERGADLLAAHRDHQFPRQATSTGAAAAAVPVSRNPSATRDLADAETSG